ncbi:MAG: O-methyltransferase [Mycobacteriaceae bacterium]
MTSSVPTNPAERILAHVELSVVEDEVLVSARERANDLGAKPVTGSVGATLSFLARVMAARTVVEIGTGAGVSGVWLLRGMRQDGVLTTIDIEPEHQRAAKRAFGDAGMSAGRFRMINGRALEVLPRLTDAGYDLVFVDATQVDHPRYLAEALRLLRSGGAVVLHGSLAGGRVSDPTQRDPATVALRETARAIAEDERLVPVLLPLGDGLQAAVLAT